MKTLADLIIDKNRIAEQHWNDKLTFNRDEVWSLLALIERLEEKVDVQGRIIDEFQRTQSDTLAGALKRLREGNADLKKEEA